MPSIADLFISVSSDVSGAISGLTDVDAKVNGVSSSMQAAAPAGYALAAAAGAVGAGFLSSITAATDFEHQMNGIKAVMSPTEVQVYGAAIEDLAIKLGRDTVFSASQAAAGIEEMIKAGVPLPAILSGAAASALDLAAATGVSVTQAAQLASTAMNTYHQSAAELPGIMDTISNVSNATAISVSGLQLALQAVGPVAAGIGISFSDTATALGIFANNGLIGSDAGTSLKTMLLSLEPSTKAQTAAFAALNLLTEEGTSKFFDATGAARPMNEIFQILRESTANLTQEQRINLLQTAFGTDAVRAATIAANEGAAGWDNVTAALDKMGGTQVAAAQRNAGLAGSMEQLGGSFEAIQITIGNLFLPVLTRLIDGLTSVLNAFLTLDPSIQFVLIAVVGITGVLAGLTAAFVLLSPLLAAVGAAFGIIAAVVAPVVPIILGLAAAGAALYVAWQTNFGGIRDVTQQVFDAIQPGIVNIQNFLITLRDLLAPVFANVVSAAQPLLDQLNVLATGALAQIPPLIRTIGDGFNVLSSAIQVITTGSMASLLEFLARAGPEFEGVAAVLLRVHDAFVFLGGILNIVGDAMQVLLTGSMTSLLNLMTDAGPQAEGLGRYLLTVRDAALTVWGAITQLAQAVGTFIGQIASGNLSGTLFDGNILGNVAGLLGQIPALLGTVFGWVQSIVSTALNGCIFDVDLVGAVTAMWQGFLDAFGAVASAIGPIWEGIKGVIGAMVGELPGLIAGSISVEGMWSGLAAAFNDLVGVLSPLWDQFAGWFGSVLGGIPQFVADTMGFVWEALATAFNDLVPLLAPFWDNFAQWLGSILSYLPQFVADTIGFVFGALADAFNTLIPLLAPLWDNFAQWFGSLLGYLPQFVADTAGDFFGWVVEQAAALADRVGQALEPLRQLLAETFGNVINWVTGGTTGTGGTGGTGTLPGTTFTGPIVQIGTLIVSSQEEANAFLDLVAQAVLASAQRVSPPVAGTNPAL